MSKSKNNRLCEFYQIGISDNKYDTFTDAFGEFISELDCVDLSEKTLQHLYDVFIKDMNIYFENKKYEKEDG